MDTLKSVDIVARGDHEIVMTRAFDAPRALVFDAFTTPAVVQRWLLGPDGWTMPVCEIELRVGGRYRYVWRHEQKGTTMGAGGIYREVTPPDRIVFTEQFDEAWYPGEAVGTLTFTENNGRTMVEQTMRYASKDARDAVLSSGMESGVTRSYDRLERLLATSA